MLENVTDRKMSFYVNKSKYVHLYKNIVWVTFYQLRIICPFLIPSSCVAGVRKIWFKYYRPSLYYFPFEAVLT